MRIYGKSKKKKKIFLQLLAKYSYLCSPQLERCSSGLRGTPGKRVYAKSVSRVRIPISPQNINTQLVAQAIGCFRYWPDGELAHRQDNDGNSQAGPPGRQLCINALAPPRRRREGMRRPPCGRAQSRSLRKIQIILQQMPHHFGTASFLLILAERKQPHGKIASSRANTDDALV